MRQNNNLNRFVEAQETTYAQAFLEIINSKKVGHWIWFIFPQIVDLGTSPISRKFAIQSKAETIAYYNHPVLGKRLIEMFQLLLDIDCSSAFTILGHPDYLKLKSSATLFNQFIKEEPVFQKVLDKFYDGRQDDMTLMILSTL